MTSFCIMAVRDLEALPRRSQGFVLGLKVSAEAHSDRGGRLAQRDAVENNETCLAAAAERRLCSIEKRSSG